jgi:hypothetical protein
MAKEDKETEERLRLLEYQRKRMASLYRRGCAIADMMRNLESMANEVLSELRDILDIHGYGEE